MAEQEVKEEGRGLGDWFLLGLIALGIWYVFFRKPYKCPYCGAAFKTEEELAAHIAAEHPGEPPPQGGELAASVRFESPPDFYQGSTHEVVITLKNNGSALAAISSMRIDFQSYVKGSWSYTGLTPWSPVLTISPSSLNPGQTAEYRGTFTIPTNAEVDNYRYRLQVWYNGKYLDWSSANAPNKAYAFTVLKAEASIQALSVSFI